MKKILFNCIAILMSMLMLVACTGGGKDKGDTASDTGNTGSMATSSDASGATSENQNSGKSKVEGITQTNYPIVDGSTATMPLMAAVYSELLGVSGEEAETFVEVSTTAFAWRNLLNSSADLLIVYEAPDSVKKEIESSDVKLETTPIGRDGLVFLANTQNKVNSLSQEQIKDIYTGKTKNWKELGGDDSEIIPFQRDEESGSQTLFEKLVLKGTKPMEAPHELIPADMGGLVDGVAYYDGSNGAIGYSVFYYASEMYSKPNLKLLEVDGVAPSIETIGSGKYPLINNFYVAIRQSEPENSPARLLYNWLKGEDGAKIVEKSGYAPVKE